MYCPRRGIDPEAGRPIDSSRGGVHARPFVGVFQKSILDRFVIFWRFFPSKRLQSRPQNPKPSPGIPPEGPFVEPGPSQPPIDSSDPVLAGAGDSPSLGVALDDGSRLLVERAVDGAVSLMRQ